MIYVVEYEGRISNGIYVVNTLLYNDRVVRIYFAETADVRRCKFFASSHSYVRGHLDCITTPDIVFRKPKALARDIVARRVPLLQVLRANDLVLLSEIYFGDYLELESEKVRKLCIQNIL